MKKMLQILSLALLSSISSFASADCKLSVRVFDFAPQFIQDKQGQWHGMAIELIQAVLQEANCSAQFNNVSWKRALHLLEHGGLDIMLNMSVTAERQKYLHFIGPLRDETMILVAPRRLKSEISSLEDIKQLSKRVGILRGAYYGTEFALQMQNDPAFAKRFEQADSTDINIGKLKKQRIAGFFNDKYNASYILKNKLDGSQYKIQPLILNQNFVYIGVSKKSVSAELRELLVQAFARAKSEGKLNKILSKYNDSSP
ncbi:MAG: hypothetical protein OFPI_28100 [Osedax symbiont Rs2]|nr:MAG: hypothetical protein OFPI_28100 [Osedax symbiont Rs2]